MTFDATTNDFAGYTHQLGGGGVSSSSRDHRKGSQSLRHQCATEREEMSFNNNPRKIQGNVSAIFAAIKDWSSTTRLSVKDVARRIDATPRTVENWLSEQNEPRASKLVALMRESDEVFEVVCELAGRETPPSLNPTQRQALAEALRQLED